MKNTIFFLFLLIFLLGKAQNLTGNFSAFEKLRNDVSNSLDSCLLLDKKVTHSKSTSFWIEVDLDSVGYIYTMKILNNKEIFDDIFGCDIEQIICSLTNQYDIYIDDYHYFKDIFWQLHDYAIYYIHYNIE